jgi:ADP-heptose:LPS heptosyltransferase
LEVKIIGFNQGQIGDLGYCTVAARAVKQQFPGSHLTFSINKRYASAAPLFYFHPYIDEVKIWDGYDNWPTAEDEEYIKRNKFDLFFHPMPKNTSDFWYLHHTHAQEMCLMNRINPPEDLSICLNQYFKFLPQYEDYVAFTCFSSGKEVRDIPVDYANKVVQLVKSLGYKTIQLGLDTHPKLDTDKPVERRSIFEDVIIARSCRMLITADTGMNVLLAGYMHKVLGLYARNSYPVDVPVVNRSPFNLNSVYLIENSIPEISLDKVGQTFLSLINK